MFSKVMRRQLSPPEQCLGLAHGEPRRLLSYAWGRCREHETLAAITLIATASWL